MACEGCLEKSKKLQARKRRAMEEKIENKMVDKRTLHFMSVCPHGVPDGYSCKTCDKIIKIPEDAVIKPVVNDKDKDKDKDA